MLYLSNRLLFGKSCSLNWPMGMLTETINISRRTYRYLITLGLVTGLGIVSRLIPVGSIWRLLSGFEPDLTQGHHCSEGFLDGRIRRRH